jgi:hypothetical protein
MNSREYGRNRKNRSLRRMKKRGTGGRSHPVESIAQKLLSLRFLRLGLCHTHGLGDFGTQSGVTSCDADG